MCTALTAALLLRDSAYCFDADVGNMMWQHTVAQMIAEELDASMYVAVTREIPTTGEKWFPPNTAEGEEAVRALLPRELFWDNLPSDHPHKRLCLLTNISYLARVKDYKRRMRIPGAVKELKAMIRSYASEIRGDYCMLMLGYFQRIAPSISSAKIMWSGFLDIPLKRIPDSEDIGLYIRCTSHYPKPSKYLFDVLYC